MSTSNTPSFQLDREAILKHPRTAFVRGLVPIDCHLDDMEHFIQEIFVKLGYTPVQSGRVVALRITDRERLISAFKSALYLGKYDDMANTTRFLTHMVSAGHSYEPIRGESVLFLYIGVGKPVYDHMITYSAGRYTRIAGGQRANLPWGYEVPTEAKGDVLTFKNHGVRAVEAVINTVRGLDEDTEKQQIQAARSLLPVGFIMPPFAFEFSEEALIKHVFRQRIFEPGVQGATAEIAQDMWECMMKYDPEKWLHLFDYHGPHIDNWKKAMRTLRDKEITIGGLLALADKQNLLDNALITEGEESGQYDLNSLNLYDILMATLGKLPPSMWDKK